MEELHKIKILRNKGISGKIFIDGKEIKGVTSLNINNSTTKGRDSTSVFIEIGYLESLEIVETSENKKLNLKAESCPLAISLKWDSLGENTSYLIFIDGISAASTDSDHALIGVVQPGLHDVELMAVRGEEKILKETIKTEVAGLKNLFVDVSKLLQN